MGTTGNDWLIGLLYVREGSHTPYRYVLNNSRIRPRTDENMPFIKELRRSGEEFWGLDGKLKKIKFSHTDFQP
jgi:hypothetical protein